MVREHRKRRKARQTASRVEVSADPRGVGGSCACVGGFERDKGIRWMPWHQEAMKDVARCEKPWGAASRL
jgi:hypothetical protein